MNNSDFLSCLLGKGERKMGFFGGFREKFVFMFGLGEKWIRGQ